MSTKKLKKMGLDVGNSGVKVAMDYGDGTIVSPFVAPSFIYSPRPREQFQPSQFSHKVEYLQGPDSLKGLEKTQWIVGEWAQMQGGQPTFTADSKKEVQAKAVLAFIPEDVATVEELRLCLPSLDVDELAPVIQDQLQGSHTYRIDGSLSTVVIKKVTVSLEGVDAYRYLAHNKLFQYPKGVNAIIDIGGGTLAAMCFKDGVPLVGTREVCDGLTRAADSLVSHPVLDNVESKGTNPLVERIIEGIEDGTFMYGCTGRSFKKEFEEYVYGGSGGDGWLGSAQARIRTKFKSFIASKDLSQIAVIGGAADLFRPLIKDTKGRVFIPKDPRLVTVKGMLI